MGHEEPSTEQEGTNEEKGAPDSAGVESDATRSRLSHRKPRPTPTMMNSAKGSPGTFGRQVFLTVLDKGMLGLGLVVATMVFGARLEAVKRADAQTVELTKIRVAEINSHYQGSIGMLVEHNMYVEGMKERFRNGASRDELERTRTEYEAAMRRRRTAQTDPLWIEAPLSKALTDFDLACQAYENVVGHIQINCVVDQMAPNTMGGAQLTQLWEECKSTCGAEKPGDNEMAARVLGTMAANLIGLQKAIQAYAATATARPASPF
jgi:hypothetical protein